MEASPIASLEKNENGLINNLIRGFVARISPLLLDPFPKINAYSMLAHFSVEIFQGAAFKILFFSFYSSSQAYAGYYPLTLTSFFPPLLQMAMEKSFGDLMLMQSSHAICLLFITFFGTLFFLLFFFSWTAWRGTKKRNWIPTRYRLCGIWVTFVHLLLFRFLLFLLLFLVCFDDGMQWTTTVSQGMHTPPLNIWLFTDKHLHKERTHMKGII